MASSANPNNPPQEASADSATIVEIRIHSTSDTTAVMEEATVPPKIESTTVPVVKVKRQIKTPGSTAAGSSGPQRHKKPISKASNKDSKLTSSTESPKKPTDQSIVQQSTNPIESPDQSEEATKPTQPTRKLETVSKASRTFGKFHRVYRYIFRVVKRVDSSSDAGNLEDDVSSMGSSLDSDVSESDDDDDSDHGEDSDSDSKPKAVSSESPAHKKRVERPGKEAELEIQVHEEKGNNYTIKSHETECLGSNDAESARRVQHKTARRLTKRSASWTRLLIWSIVILLPLFFICLGVFVACLHNKPTSYSKLQDGIQEASKAAVTVWPIAFAAIAAQSLKALANYKLESGIRLMTVEQLISCHSVAGAIKQPFILRRLNWVTIALAGLWSLSPLASQAMQRWYYPVPAIVNGNDTLYYLNTAQNNYGLQYVNFTTNQTLWNLQDGYLAPMDELFAAAFLPSTQQQLLSSDPWNNPLIPIYEELDLDEIDKDGWVTLRQDTVNGPQFSSLFGIPIVNTSNITNGAWNFLIRSSYLYFDCPFLNSTTLDQLSNDTFFGDISNSTTTESLNSPTLWASWSETLLMGMTPPAQSMPGTLTFLSGINDAEGNALGPKGTQTYAYSVCSFNQTFVDSNISVYYDTWSGNLEYTVLAMRKVPLPPTNIGDFMADFVGASGIGGSENSNNSLTMTERYILNPLNMTDPGKFFINLTAVPLPDFTQRLSLLVNTFYSGGFAPQFQTGNLEDNTTVEIYDGPHFLRNQSILASTTATFDYQSKTLYVYTVSWVWVIIQEICSVTLLVFGIASVIWEANTLAPDLLGFASSVPRKSKYVKFPKLGSTLDGAERARRMAKKKVMMQDVRPDDDEGMIVLGNATEEAHRLTLGRLYR